MNLPTIPDATLWKMLERFRPVTRNPNFLTDGFTVHNELSRNTGVFGNLGIHGEIEEKAFNADRLAFVKFLGFGFEGDKAGAVARLGFKHIEIAVGAARHEKVGVRLRHHG